MAVIIFRALGRSGLFCFLSLFRSVHGIVRCHSVGHAIGDWHGVSEMLIARQGVVELIWIDMSLV